MLLIGQASTYHALSAGSGKFVQDDLNAKFAYGQADDIDPETLPGVQAHGWQEYFMQQSEDMQCKFVAVAFMELSAYRGKFVIRRNDNQAPEACSRCGEEGDAIEETATNKQSQRTIQDIITVLG